MTDPVIPDVAVAGLLIPATLAPRIIAALRHQYPTITADRDDEGVVRAVLKWIIESTLASYEGQVVQAAAEGELEKIREEFRGKADKARTKAQEDARAIREIPSGAAEPNLPT